MKMSQRALRYIPAEPTYPAMSLIETNSEQIPAQIGQKPVKKKRIPRRIAEVVRLLVSGECKTQRAAAERCGMSETYISGALRKPEVVAYLEQETRAALTRSQAPAAATMLRLLDQAQSEHVQKDVAIHLLALNGHKPANTQQVSVSVDIKAGFVIDLSEPAQQPVIDVSHKRLAHD